MPPALLTRDEQEEVLRHLRSGDKVKAIIAVRRFTGQDTKGAMAALKAFGPAELYAENHMGMTSDVLAIGPFGDAILDHMEYPPKFYVDTREGAPIVRTVFQVYEGSSRSRELAGCFGIDPWDFNQHELDPARADLAKLRATLGPDEVATFEALRGAGFKFYVRPNG